MGQAPACHAEWQRVLTRLAREHSSPADLYMERARLEHEHLGDWREAMESCLYALRYDAFAAEATALVERIANENDAWAVLAQALSRLRDAASEEQHAEYDRWLARINAEQLGDAASAFALHEQAWRQDPSSTEARRLFVHAAEDLGFEERALRLVVNETPSDAESAKAWCDWVVPHALAKGQVDVALEQLRATVTALGDQADNWVPGTQRYWHQMSPADGAYAWFIEYSREVGSDAAFVAVLQAAARFAPTDTLKADALHAIAELAPNDGATRDALWLALDAAGRHEELSESLRVAALAEGSDEEATALALRAVHHARRAEHDAGHQAAVLASLVERLPRHDELRDDYELALREAEAWLPLVESLADRSAFAASPQAAEPFWLRGADLLDGIMEDAAAAAAFLQRAHEAGHDTPEVVRRRAALYEACGNWEAVVDDGEVLAKVLEGAPAAHALGQSALLSETRLGDALRAAELWRRALELSVDWKRPHLRLALIHEANGDEESAYQHLDAAEALPSDYEASDVPDVCALLVRRASGAGDRGEAWLRRALELSPGYTLALRALVEHLCVGERHADAAAALDDAAAAAAPAEAAVIHLERAGILMHAADDPVAAAKAVGRARSLAPESRAVAAVEGDVHLAAGRFPDAVEAYHLALGFEESLPDDVPEPRLFVQHETPASPLTLYLTRYALALEASGRARDAYDAFQSATLEDDGHPLALAGLARVAHGRDERDAHARYRQELAAVTERGPSAVSALLDALPAFD